MLVARLDPLCLIARVPAIVLGPLHLCGQSRRGLSMLRRLPDLAPWIALTVVLASVHLCTSRGALDDLAVLYSNAWLETCAESDAVPVRLREHFEQYGAGLPPVDQARYATRLELGRSNNYGLLALSIRVAEKLGSPPGLRTVMLADLAEHLCAAFLVLGLAGRRHGWLVLGLLAGAVLALTLWSAEPFEPWVAFQGRNMSWLSSAPRGAAVLAWFGGLAALLQLNGGRRFALAAAFAALSVACHRSMAMLCFAMTLPTLGLWWAVRERMPARPRPGALFAVFLAIIAVVAGGKLAVLVHYGSRGVYPLMPLPAGTSQAFVRPILTLVAWAVGVLVVLAAWLRIRGRAGASAQLRRSGDALAALLTVTGGVSLGLNAFHGDRELWFGPLFFLTEASMRSIVVPHAIFLALAALCWHALSPQWARWAALALATVACGVAVWQFVEHENPELPSKPVELSRLLKRGIRAYESEPTYFFSVARRVATRGCNGP